jgi:7-keto-8-aminopelargonate synthetase-like enzyme
VIADQNAHASIVDGAILSKATCALLPAQQPGRPGEEAQAGHRQEARRHRGRVLDGRRHLPAARARGRGQAVRRAHPARRGALGVRLRPRRARAGREYGLDDAIDIHIGTFSKALGGQGGYVAGSQQLYNYLKGFARSRVFSCALSPVVAAGVLKALEIAQAEPELRDQLWANVRHIRGRLEEAGVDVGDSTSQVIPIMVRNDRRVFEICHRLLAPASTCSR